MRQNIVDRDDLLGFQFDRQSQPQLEANHSNFVYQQNNYGRQCAPGRQRITAEEVQGHGNPARATSDQSAPDIPHRDCVGEVCAMEVPKPEDLTERPDDDEELNRDSDLSPTLSGHEENCSCIPAYADYPTRECWDIHVEQLCEWRSQIRLACGRGSGQPGAGTGCKIGARLRVRTVMSSSWPKHCAVSAICFAGCRVRTGRRSKP